MARPSGCNWAPTILVAYVMLAAVASCLLAPSCVPEQSGVSSGSAVEWEYPCGDLFVAAVGLFVSLMGVGLVFAIAAASFVDSVAKYIRARKRQRKKKTQGGQQSGSAR